jgi:hypothetical protein
MTLPNPIDILKMMVRAVPAVVEHLSEDAIKAAGYDGINTVMRAAVYDAVYFYLTSGTGHVTNYRNAMSTAISKAYIETVELAYQEGGGELPLDDDTAAWARAQLDAQLGYVDELFAGLRELRRAGDFDAGEVATARAAGYASGLDGFFVEAKMRGSKNIVLTWHLGDTEKHCKDCAKLDGQSHKISWYVERDYIPRKNGASMECGGYNCSCFLTDRSGNEYTV